MEPAVRKKSTGTPPLFLWNPKTLNCFMVLFEWFQHFKCEIAMWFFLIFSLPMMLACLEWETTVMAAITFTGEFGLVSFLTPQLLLLMMIKTFSSFHGSIRVCKSVFHSSVVQLDLRSASHLAIKCLWNSDPPPNSIQRPLKPFMERLDGCRVKSQAQTIPIVGGLISDVSCPPSITSSFGSSCRKQP